MSSSPSQPATDLREAYRVCEPKPLDGDDFEKYYEPLLDEDDFDAVKAIGASLFVQELGEHKTFFLAGHRGCGKTTQLNLLIKNWCSDYHVIYIEADKTANINNIDYIDIYLLVSAQSTSTSKSKTKDKDRDNSKSKVRFQLMHHALAIIV